MKEKKNTLFGAFRNPKYPFINIVIVYQSIFIELNTLLIAIGLDIPEGPSCIFPLTIETESRMKNCKRSTCDYNHRPFKNHEYLFIIGNIAIETSMKFGKAINGSNKNAYRGCPKPCEC